MKKLWAVIRWVLIIWGAICMLWILFIVGSLVFRFGTGWEPSTKIADKNEALGILSSCGLNEAGVQEVLHSYKSQSPFLSDHLYAHAIKISHVDPEKLPKENFDSGWSRCDQATGMIKDAINFAAGWHEPGVTWFPSDEQLNSSEMYVYPVRIKFHGLRVEGAELIFYRPADNMIFYMDGET